MREQAARRSAERQRAAEAFARARRRRGRRRGRSRRLPRGRAARRGGGASRPRSRRLGLRPGRQRRQLHLPELRRLAAARRPRGPDPGRDLRRRDVGAGRRAQLARDGARWWTSTQRFVREDGEPAHDLLASRLLTAFWGVFAGVRRARRPGSSARRSRSSTASARYFYGSILGVFGLAVLTPRASAAGPSTALFAGMAAVFLVRRLTRVAFLWYNVVSAVTVFVVGPAITALAPEKPGGRRDVTRPQSGWPPRRFHAADAQRRAPFPARSGDRRAAALRRNLPREQLHLPGLARRLSCRHRS